MKVKVNTFTLYFQNHHLLLAAGHLRHSAVAGLDKSAYVLTKVFDEQFNADTYDKRHSAPAAVASGLGGE